MNKIRTEKINLSAMKYRRQPFESFGRLRDLGPLVPARITLIGKVWLITSYDAVDEALKNDKLFCRDPTNAGRRNFPVLRMLMPGVFQRLSQNMIGKDEPDHRRLRVLVDQAFQRQSITALRPRIQGFADEQLDRIEQVALEQDGVVDLVEHLARPIPLTVICELLGLPMEGRVKFRKWFGSFSNVKSMLSIVRIVPGLRKTLKYMERQFKEVQINPGEGLITALVQAEQEGDRLTNEELQSMVMLLLLAGHETTVHLLSTSVLTMLQLPDVRRQLLADWSLIGSAVEEMLRYNSSAQFAKPRWVTENTEFHGQALRRGEVVMPVLACANYDPRRFDAPEQFRIVRPNNYHLTFGTGPHVCLAMKLAVAETQIVLQRLFTRWPEMRPAFELTDPDWAARMGMRALNSLAVRLV